MKILSYLFTILLVIIMTGMTQTTEDISQQETKAFNLRDTKPLFHKGMITIKLKDGVGDYHAQRGAVSFNIPSLDDKVSRYKVDRLEKRYRYNPQKLEDDLPNLSRLYWIEFPEKLSVTKVAREFSKDTNIEYAEPIPYIHLFEIPHDPMYGDLHHLPQIKADSAWDIHKGENGTEEVVIAIVDSGTEWDHEDLIDNIWQNMGEDADGDGKTIEYLSGEWVFDPDDENGVDDDGNGYTDDFIGWNFHNSDNDPNPIPGTYKWTHGTLIAGYAGASTNNGVGVASIPWNLKIIPIQAGWEAIPYQAYNAIIYAAENGADVISCSWGNYGFTSLAYQEAIDYANGLGSIIVSAAANDDVFRNYMPATSPGVISVAALNQYDEKASYSNFGSSVNISAPGGDDNGELLTTDVDNSYGSAMGTSCATPIVAGLLGLVKSYHPEWTREQVITQVFGTADDIDPINPGYENQLGSGCINAYRALTETDVSLDQEIALDYCGLTFHDADDNDILEAGDTAVLNLKLRNYNWGVGAEDATFNLITEDPDITITIDTYIADIPADNFYTLESAFEIKIAEQATAHLAEFKLITTADVEITWGDTLSFQLLVAPHGILVYQGDGTGDAFSGDYINEFLVDQGFQVFYTSHFPSSLEGFDATFLSYGNYDYNHRGGVNFTMEEAQTIQDYLANGGKMYVECGTFFGMQVYHHYPDVSELMDLFGVDTVETPQTHNRINYLVGEQGSICEDLIFKASSQYPFWYIDKITPNENGVAAFDEANYGNVAVQGVGAYGQKTFIFSYAVSKLLENEESTRDEVMSRIIDFFGLITNVEDDNMSTKLGSDLEIFPNPFSNFITVEYELDQPENVRIIFYDQFGKQVDEIEEYQSKGYNQVIWTPENLQTGIYYFRIATGRLHAGKQVASGKVVKVE